MMVIHNLGGELLASSNQGLEWLRETAKGLGGKGAGVRCSPHRALYIYSPHNNARTRSKGRPVNQSEEPESLL
jgi:hypothetical protein